jgi:formylmethanofuran dehydrogenase subunit E
MNPLTEAGLDDGPWCNTHAGKAYTFEEYLSLVRDFHGHAAPGLLIGGKMVDAALSRISGEVIFDVICETGNCLPDAVQLLTLCTIGNG